MGVKLAANGAKDDDLGQRARLGDIGYDSETMRTPLTEIPIQGPLDRDVRCQPVHLGHSFRQQIRRLLIPRYELRRIPNSREIGLVIQYGLVRVPRALGDGVKVIRRVTLGILSFEQVRVGRRLFGKEVRVAFGEVFAVTASADVRGSSGGPRQDAGSEDERDGCQGRDVEAKERRGRSDHGRIDSSL